MTEYIRNTLVFLLLIVMTCDRYFNGHFWSNSLNMHIIVFSESRSVRIDILWSNARHFFQPLFWPEVDDTVQGWFAIPNIVIRTGTYIPNFKKIGSKLWPWQCHRFSDQDGGQNVINYANEPKHKRAQLDP